MGHHATQRQRTILFVTRSPEFGGAEVHLLQLVRRLSGHDVVVSIMCLEPDCYSARLLGDHNNDITVLRERHADSGWRWYRILRGVRPDIVVFVRSWVWCLPWYTCAVAWLARIPRRFAIVHLQPTALPKVTSWSVRNLAPAFMRLRKSVSTRRIAIGCTSTVCVSDAIRNSLVNDYGFPAHRTITVHNGVSVSTSERNEELRQYTRTILNVQSEELLLICVARLTSIKRIDVLLSALSLIAREGMRWKCVVVGDGPLKQELYQQARALGISDRVLFEGFREDVQTYLNAADLFVLTSDIEGLPLSILEAMSCGLPCVVTNVGGNAEVITHQVDGLLVPPGSAKAIADAIIFLNNNPREYSQMSQFARAKVRHLFDIEQRMAELQEKILA